MLPSYASFSPLCEERAAFKTDTSEHIADWGTQTTGEMTHFGKRV